MTALAELLYRSLRDRVEYDARPAELAHARAHHRTRAAYSGWPAFDPATRGKS